MTNTDKAGSEYVKKETMIMITSIFFVVGFIAGVAFSVYKSSPNQQAFPRTSSPQNLPQQMGEPRGPAPEQIRMIQALEKKISNNPQDVASRIQLGNLYFDTNQYENAIKAYKKSLELNPQNADIWTDLGIMYRRNEQPEMAIESFDKAISIDPRREASRFNKGIVLMHDLNDIDGAVQAWEALIEINPNALTPAGGQSLKEMIDRLKLNRQ